MSRGRHKRFKHWEEWEIIIKSKVFLTAIAAIVIYVLLFWGIRHFGQKLEFGEQEPVWGDLSDSIVSGVTLDYEGRTYVYRKADLTNILVIGVDVDTLVGETRGGRNGGQADVLMLLVMDRQNKTITPIPIDRDTITEIPIYGVFGDAAGTREAQISLSHAFGNTEDERSEHTVDAVERLFGSVTVDHYLTMDMGGIAILNDTLGGVTVTLEDDFTHYDPSMAEGVTLTLKGKQAEYYVRGRMDMSVGTNAARMRRQETFLESALALLRTHMEESLSFMGELVDALAGHMVTDMTRGQLINDAYVYQRYQTREARPILGKHVVNEEGFSEFHSDVDALEALIIDVFFEPRDD